MSAETETTAEDVEPAVPAERVVGAVVLVAGLIGFVAAFVLAVEKYWLLTNPFYVPSCSVNATLSCGPVMNSDQAAVLGFPNPYLGIAGFAVCAALGAVLLSGGRIATGILLALSAGSLVASGFVVWLIIQSLFVIRALCPYCMAVWVATFTIAWYALLATLRRLGHRLPPRVARLGDLAAGNHSTVLAGWLLLVAGLVVAFALRLATGR